MRALLLVLVAAVAVEARICPLQNHTICNSKHQFHDCVCTITTEQEVPPRQSCTNFIKRTEDGDFPVVQVVFNLEDETETLEYFPEEEFVEKIANALRVDEDDVLLLRVNCLGTEDTLTVQFAVLKKTTEQRPSKPDNEGKGGPYSEDEFVDAEGIATRMKSMGHLSDIADLNTRELIPIEFDPDNTSLIIEAILSGFLFSALTILGVYVLCRCGPEVYSDDLQKA